MSNKAQISLNLGSEESRVVMPSELAQQKESLVRFLAPAKKVWEESYPLMDPEMTG